ncbi:hypothetical protein FISHEDRAFT_74814 [Fistulina hepatica ATCC 64428]|uniref:Uncharacterized protein n=1 Tax=Fistulina hepatica ATCC 64428 TaxID=1128425 RepID=A0A0D7A902_9AGAR|nr:hypothetical protein FISHEDRAFT_74814 [Fistulina hepatica ATCC 64428]
MPSESMAAGTAFAITYKSEIEDIEVEDLIVFTTLQNTPFKHLTTYEVPAALPACPDEGCNCAWGWVPSGPVEGILVPRTF